MLTNENVLEGRSSSLTDELEAGTSQAYHLENGINIQHCHGINHIYKSVVIALMQVPHSVPQKEQHPHPVKDTNEHLFSFEKAFRIESVFVVL